jgi:hypothetical protein
MTFAEEVVGLRIPPRIYKDKRNEIQDMDFDTYADILVENGHHTKLAYFNGQWYDVKEYIRKAADEIGNVGSVNNREHSEICTKYADQFVQDALAGKAKPVRIPKSSKQKRTAEA